MASNMVSKPMSIKAGLEYDAWITRLTTGLKELITEGAAPAFPNLEQFLALSDRLRRHVRTGADQASQSGRATFSIDVPFTDQERRMLSEMGQSLLSYLDILTIRGKIDSKMSPGVEEAIAAMGPV